MNRSKLEIMRNCEEGPFKAGNTFKVFWEGNTLPQKHPTKASAQAHFDGLCEQRKIKQRALDVDITKDITQSGLEGRPKDLSAVQALVRGHEKLSLELMALLAEAAAIQEKIEKIELDSLPNLLMSLGIPKIPVMISDGTTLFHNVEVKIEDTVRASIPSKTAIEKAKTDEERDELSHRKEQAFSWLRDHDAGSLIKNLLIVPIPKGKDALADKVTAFVAKLKLAAEREETVHPSTLSKHVRETLEAGNMIPFDIFKVSVGKIARINNPKLKEEKKNVKNNDTSEDFPF